MILPTIHALWISNTLGAISRCCLSSFVKCGHQVFLYVYDDIHDLPDGVVIKDANQIIPKNKIVRHKKQEVMPCSQIFFAMNYYIK